MVRLHQHGLRLTGLGRRVGALRSQLIEYLCLSVCIGGPSALSHEVTARRAAQTIDRGLAYQ
jgi:hypothetical protein